MISKQIQETHGLLLHRINQPAAIDKITFAGCNRMIEF